MTKTMSQYLEQAPESPINAEVARLPLRRLVMLEEVADSIALLASPMTSFMQGAYLAVGSN